VLFIYVLAVSLNLGPRRIYDWARELFAGRTPVLARR
jgi:hypothetical protein